ncbi:tripartite tricarboxylate transporter substrate binding protein [Pusillimonas sp. MFBS29]|uniref:Bug family tripartite tricarboxylate transporter substrate binding protein n=1 Tax=Pusillimonas sp. MFBS29 TaxID=2886690 RepID=UPI001D0FD72B|nr:tripartite tricarboxylate transporter substrate binding protein [Pusillimonas sp. MFBS29]MCC2595408.1 tripartite tricarboxylate transporter substrate binding protein [Pusillimonas sp. MFBS29]
MMIITRSVLLAATLSLAVLGPAAAQSDYPNRPVKIVVPYSAGGIVDSIARLLGDQLSSMYDQPVVVENKAGAAGAIGMNYVANAPADGYTLMVASPALAVLPILKETAKWNVAQDYRSIEGLGIVPNVLVVHPSVPAKTMAEFVDLAKKSDTPLTYATAGLGSSNHLSGELLVQEAGIKLTEVAYKGQTDALTDLLTGRVQMMALTSALAIPYIKEGKLRPLAVTTGKRTVATPDLPTVAEAAQLPNYAVGTWFGLVTQKKVPDAIVEQLSKDVAEIMAKPEVKAKFDTLGMELDLMGPAEFDGYLEEEHSKWSKVMKKAGLSIQ